MSVTVDMSDLIRLRDNLVQLQNVDFDAMATEITNKLALLMLRKVKKRTPVGIYNTQGMVGGTLRRNWQVGNIEKVGNVYKIEVFNPTHYARYVEYGHRTRNHNGWVDGRFMMTISANEVESQKDIVVKNIVMRYLREAFAI